MYTWVTVHVMPLPGSHASTGCSGARKGRCASAAAEAAAGGEPFQAAFKASSAKGAALRLHWPSERCGVKPWAPALAVSSHLCKALAMLRPLRWDQAATLTQGSSPNKRSGDLRMFFSAIFCLCHSFLTIESAAYRTWRSINCALSLSHECLRSC